MGKVVCPACGAQDLDVCAYDTMLVVIICTESCAVNLIVPIGIGCTEQ